ncbi:hypothetical protein Dda_6429 [Drechslerella dactyloides]|uniref:Uncharacterized protein n=1 Tax=Drechslerella dactyloides TaxID=74499 RepID=A0AAD6ITK0_DREDA|nr:hypothetical protein Dda_6429 [Drechslerella dactyloides]
MPLRCPAGAARVAPSLLASAYTPLLSPRWIPPRICTSCRARRSLRKLSTWPVRRRPTPLRYQLLTDNLRPHPHSPPPRHAYLLPSLSAASYASDRHFNYTSIRDKGKLPSRRLVILSMLTPKRRLVLSDVEVDKNDVANLTQSLQTFEYQTQEEEITDEILLFKPEELRVSRSRFMQLYKELNQAFLGTQIKEYLATTEVDFAGGLQKLRKKDALNLVLREVWKVEVAEEIAAEMDVIREKELKFRRMDLFFMMAEGGEMLQKLASENRTRIILNSQNNTLLLRGSKRAIETIERTLKTLPDLILDREVDLSPLMRVGHVNENYITAISRLTATFLELNDNKITLHSVNNYGSSNIEDAQRLVFNSVDLHLRQTYSLLGETKPTESLMGGLYPVSEDQALPWLYRGRNWSRWRSIRPPNSWRESRAADELTLEEEELSLSKPLSLEDAAHGSNINYSDLRSFLDSPPISSATPIPPTTIPEDAETSTTYHAVLGQVLHSSPNLPSIREPQSLSAVLSADPSHVLCHSVPRTVDFLSTLNPVTLRYDFKILLKFSPSPWLNPANFELLPPVEMELHINPEINEVLSLKIGAIESHNIVDILMPRNASDVRFVRRRLVRIESKTPDVERYLKSADLDVLGEERLRAGEELVLNVPKWMLKNTARDETWALDEDGNVVDEAVTPANPPASESQLEYAEEPVDEAAETVPVTYYFTGLETRSSTIFDFDGAPLIYTKVEAGASGGSYDEVILECTPDTIEYLTPLEEQRLGREDEFDDREWDEKMQQWSTEEESKIRKAADERVADTGLDFLTGGEPVEAAGEPSAIADPEAESTPVGESSVTAELEAEDAPTATEVEATADVTVDAEAAPSSEATVTDDDDARMQAELEALVSSATAESAEPSELEASEDDASAGYISDAVFHRFVKTARKLVEAVEKTHASGKKRLL